MQDTGGVDCDEHPMQKLDRLLWAMTTASMRINGEGDTEAATLPSDQFAAAKSLLIAMRNERVHKVEKLLRVIPDVGIQDITWSQQSEERILAYMAKCHEKKTTQK